MSMEGFLEIYTKVTKDDIRQNRRNVAEKLDFLGASFTVRIRESGSRNCDDVRESSPWWDNGRSWKLPP